MCRYSKCRTLAGKCIQDQPEIQGSWADAASAMELPENPNLQEGST